MYEPRIPSFEGVGVYVKKNHEILNSHLFSINELSTKKNIQNYCFVIYYNVTIYKQRQRYKTPLFLTRLEHLHLHLHLHELLINAIISYSLVSVYIIIFFYRVFVYIISFMC